MIINYAILFGLGVLIAVFIIVTNASQPPTGDDWQHQKDITTTGNNKLDELFLWQYHWERGNAKVKKKTGREQPLGIIDHVSGGGVLVLKTPYGYLCVESNEELVVGDLVSGILLEEEVRK